MNEPAPEVPQQPSESTRGESARAEPPAWMSDEPAAPPAQSQPEQPPPLERVRAEPLRSGEPRGPAIDVRGAPSAEAGAAAGASPPPPPGAPAQAPGAAAPTARRSRIWAGLCHLAFLLPLHLPGIVLTVIVWMWRRAKDPDVAVQGREALNMQLTFWLVNLVLGLTVVGAPLVVFVYVVGAILCILATIRMADGETYRYPWILRIVA